MPKPASLKPGDTLGFVGPSGAIPKPQTLDMAVCAAEALGFSVKVGESCRAKYGYLSGDDELRARDVNRMFADDSVDAIVCVRGGYGTPRILDGIDYESARNNPKLLIGFSDITGLHLALNAQCAMPTLHGPMPSSDGIIPEFEAFTKASLLDALFDRQVGRDMPVPDGERLRGLSGGVAEGVLVGGNLTLVCSLMGTPYLPDFTGKLLFLEEVDERLYRVDRMLTQLRLGAVFEKCAGVVLGGFTRCENEYEDRALSLSQILTDVLLPCGKPVLSGLAAGHLTPKLSLPLGVCYRLDADNAALKLLESPFAQPF